MRIVAEEIVVVPHGAADEVLIILDGYRIALTEDEARTVHARLGEAVAALSRRAAPAPSPEASAPAPVEGVTEGQVVLASLRRLTDAAAKPAS